MRILVPRAGNEAKQHHRTSRYIASPAKINDNIRYRIIVEDAPEDVPAVVRRELVFL